MLLSHDVLVTVHLVPVRSHVSLGKVGNAGLGGDGHGPHGFVLVEDVLDDIQLELGVAHEVRAFQVAIILANRDTSVTLVLVLLIYGLTWLSVWPVLLAVSMAADVLVRAEV